MYEKVSPYKIVGEILDSPTIHVRTHYFKDWNIKYQNPDIDIENQGQRILFSL